MDHSYTLLQIILMPLVGAFIGWETNVLAIKLIFRPLRPVKILGVEFQGLIPKRRAEISKNIGETLEKEFLSYDDILNQLTSEEMKFHILLNLKSIIEQKAYEELPYFLPNSLKTVITNFLGEAIDRHGGRILDELKKNLASKIKEKIKLGKLVEEKINSLELEELERLIVKLSKKELKQIEILGGVIGFFIGLIQAAFLYWTNF
ncbi:MAG: DUF445 family protein [Thermosediminibacteraceae bacterium]|nr:DUF445 family protein [Thermosediminibacteraceae bacterium]